MDVSRELLKKRLEQWDKMKASQKVYRKKRYAQMKLADSMREELTKG